jgi:hypothetical protein
MRSHWGHLKVCALKHANSDKPRTQNSNSLIAFAELGFRSEKTAEPPSVVEALSPARGKPESLSSATQAAPDHVKG